MEFHEVAKLFPLMNEQDYEALKSDIATNGLLEPIVVHRGLIVDGRQRYRACNELGIEPRMREWDGKGSLLHFVVSMNLHRRHLTTSQRAMLAADLKPLFEQEARARQGARTDLRATIPEKERGKASEHAARLVNVSPRSVESASKIREQGIPALADAVKKGDLSVALAAAIADLPKSNQKGVMSLPNKRQMRETAKHFHEVQRKTVAHQIETRTSTGEIVVPIMDLLRRTKRVLGNRDAESMAIEFFESFPYQQKALKDELIENINSAKLLCELHEIWRQRLLNQQKSGPSKVVVKRRNSKVHSL